MSDERIEELEVQVLALKMSLVAVIRLLGPDFRKQFSDVASTGIIGHIGLSTLSNTGEFESVISEMVDRVSDD